MKSPRLALVIDPHRPQYHFLPPSNWMNDPNGLIQWKGQYHLFYQHNPTAAVWGDMHWGHAVSEDLIHWVHLPIALTPTPDGQDEAGCFSGCAVVNGKPTLVYTATAGKKNEIQTQCIATSDDDLRTWSKRLVPVVGQVPAEARQTSDFRDPFVWKEDDTWYMVVGSRIKDVGGAVFLYCSANLIDWEYLNPLLVGDKTRNGMIWECPNFFRLGDQWVLIVSAHTGMETGIVYYFVGTYENYHFVPTVEGVLDYASMYAPLSFVDDQERRLLIGWLRELRPIADQREAGWSGVQSIPRELSLDKQKRLHMSVVPELERIRGRHHQFDTQTQTTDVSLRIPGTALDICAAFALESGGNCGLRLAFSPNYEERCDITYDAVGNRLTVTNKSHAPDQLHANRAWEMWHELDENEPLKLRILLDGSVMEIIANDRTSLSNRVYPLQTESTHVQVLGKVAALQSLDTWEMPSIW